jgi:hypothetical protein
MPRGGRTPKQTATATAATSSSAAAAAAAAAAAGPSRCRDGPTHTNTDVADDASTLEEKVKRWSYEDYERIMTSNTNWWEKEVRTTYHRDEEKRMGVMLARRVLVKFPGIQGYYLGTLVRYRLGYHRKSGGRNKTCREANVPVSSSALITDKAKFKAYLDLSCYRVLFDDGEVTDLDPIEAYKAFLLYNEEVRPFFRLPPTHPFYICSFYFFKLKSTYFLCHFHCFFHFVVCFHCFHDFYSTEGEGALHFEAETREETDRAWI